MADETLAILQLQKYAAYTWLTQAGAPSVWTVTMVVESMTQYGFGIRDDAVRKWCRNGDIEGVTDFGGQIGFRIPREGLLKFFAGRMVKGGLTSQDMAG